MVHLSPLLRTWYYSMQWRTTGFTLEDQERNKVGKKTVIHFVTLLYQNITAHLTGDLIFIFPSLSLTPPPLSLSLSFPIPFSFPIPLSLSSPSLSCRSLSCHSSLSLGLYHIPGAFYTPNTRAPNLIQAIESTTPPLVPSAELYGIHFTPEVCNTHQTNGNIF